MARRIKTMVLFIVTHALAAIGGATIAFLIMALCKIASEQDEK